LRFWFDQWTIFFNRNFWSGPLMNFSTTLGFLVSGVLLAGNAFTADLDSHAQKLGYIIGTDVGLSLKDQNTQVDLEALFAGIRDAYEGRGLAISDETANQVREAYIAERSAEVESQRLAISENNQKAGEAFLAQNARQKAVSVTASGLQYKVVRMGTGNRPAASDTVRVHYRGRLLDGSEFDSSYERSEPLWRRCSGSDTAKLHLDL
jgi:FKBP-type peptidyl-prolyl cis-trans isomerase FklB